MRVTHIIQDNKTSSMPAEFIFVDTETTPKVLQNGDIEQPFRLGVALYWRRRDDRQSDTLEYLRFTNIAEFWQFVDGHAQAKRKLILVAHNLQFDFMVLGGFSYLRTLGYELTKLITNGKSNIFSYRRDKRTILCLDNMNYFPVSIKALGDEVGLPKLPMAKDGDPISLWFTYCQRDVDIMYTAWRYWLSFLNVEDLGTFGMTITSQAFNAYRHRFMKHQILVKHNPVATELERASYRGGRVECFRVGHLPKQDYYMLDVNSLYPYCMKVYPYPTQQLYIKHEPELSFLEKILTNRCVIADVLVSVDKPMFGVKHHNRLIFPVGTFRVILTTQELIRAITTGSVIKIYSLSVYRRQFIFGEYVDYFYNQRLAFKREGKNVYAYLCKKMLNHLYGKFGQRNEEWVFVGQEPEPVDYVEVEIDAQTGKRYVVRCIAGQISKTCGTVEGYNSFAAISSEVTANSRLILWDLIEKAGRENVFYCDTDSLLVNQAGHDQLADELHRTALGKLKLVQKSSSVILHNVKDYQIGRKVKIKGIGKTAKKVTEDQYITYQQAGVRTALHSKNVNTMTWRRVPKTLRRIYEKGILDEYECIHPLIMLHSFETNWLDYEMMHDQYGEYASYNGRWLDDIRRLTEVVMAGEVNDLLDYRPEERAQIVTDDQEARRAGEMIYQRGR